MTGEPENMGFDVMRPDMADAARVYCCNFQQAATGLKR